MNPNNYYNKQPLPPETVISPQTAVLDPPTVAPETEAQPQEVVAQQPNIASQEPIVAPQQVVLESPVTPVEPITLTDESTSGSLSFTQQPEPVNVVKEQPVTIELPSAQTTDATILGQTAVVAPLNVQPEPTIMSDALGLELPNPEVIGDDGADRGNESYKTSTKRRTMFWSALTGLFAIALTGVVTAVIINSDSVKNNQNLNPQYNATEIPLQSISDNSRAQLGQIAQLDINGVLKVNGSLVLSANNVPKNPQIGEIYFDKTTKQVYYYDGTQFKAVANQSGIVASLGGAIGNITLGQGLTLSGNVLSDQGLVISGFSSSGINITNDSGAITLNTAYGSTANTSVQGNTTLECPVGSGNINNTSNVITLGNGGICNAITITDSPAFTGSVTTPILTNSGALTVNATSASLTLQTTNSGNIIINGAGTLDVQDATTFAGTVSVTSITDFTGSIATKQGTDFSTTGIINDANFGNASLIRLTGASPQIITGISGGRDGEQLTLVNAGTTNLSITNNDGGSIASNRIMTGIGTTISVMTGSSLNLIYDATASLWRAIGDVAGGGTGNGITNIGAVSGTPTPNGGGITGNTLNLAVGDASNAGLISTTAQTIGGAKTFSSTTNFTAASTGLAVTNNATVGGTLGVTGVTTLSGTAAVVSNSSSTALNVTSNSTGIGALINLNNSSGAQDHGVLIQRTTAGGSTTSLLTLAQVNGTATNALQISGTYTNLIYSSNFSITNSGNIVWNNDTNLYRSAADTLMTDDSLQVSGNLTVQGAAIIGNSVASLPYTSSNVIGVDLGALTTNSPENTGAYFRTQASGSAGGLGRINGSVSEAYAYGSNNFSIVRGLSTHGYNNLTSGVLTNGTGLEAQFHNINAGTTTTAQAIAARIKVEGAGGITNARGIVIDTPVTTGTITTLKGIEIIAQKTASVTTAYGIYQSGASDLNYFNGVTGIGVIPTTGGSLLQLATGTSSASGIDFGGDTNLYRSAADTLRTDDSFAIGAIINATSFTNAGVFLDSTGQLSVVRSTSGNAIKVALPGDTSARLAVTDSGSLAWGPGGLGAPGQDTNLYRSAADTLMTDDSLTVGINLAVNGNTTIGNATTDRLTVTSQLLGASPLIFQGLTDNGFTTTFAVTDPTANNTITFPDESGTICTTGSVCSGYAPSSGSSSYVQLQGSTPGSAQTGNLNITGTGILGTISVTNNATVGGTLGVTGNTTLGDLNTADATIINGTLTLDASSASSGLKVTQAGSGYALLVEDVVSDTSPFIIDASGAVLIGGTSLPANTKLYIETPGATPTRIKLLQAGIANYALDIPASTNALAFYANDVEKLRLDSAGNFGIGDTSPAAALTVGNGDLFQVNSSGAIAASTGIANSGAYVQSGSSANTFTGATTFTTTTSVTNAAGKVKLDTDAGGSINMGRIDSVASTPYIDFNSGATTVDYDTRLQASGGTGVAGGGTLTVTNASTVLSGALSVNGNSTLGDASGDTLTVNAATVAIPNGLNFDSNTLIIDAANNRVGVGVTPTQALHIAGSALLGSSGNLYFNDIGVAIGIPAANTLAFTTSGTERIRIDNTGKVGIAVTPTTQLHVSGTIRTERVGTPSQYLDLYSTGGSGVLVAGGSTSFEFNVGGRIALQLGSTGHIVNFLDQTNPTIKADHSAASAVTGIQVTAAAAGSGVTLAAISSGTNEGLKVDAKGSGDLSLQTVASGKIVVGASLTGLSASTGTTGTTEATARTDVTTVTLTAAGSFANNDVIFINNAGQDYYTRIVSGGGTTTLTVSPAVSYDISAAVTKYTIQNIGATLSDYTTQANRFFQGYFLGGVVVGAGSTTLSDGNLLSSTGLKLTSATTTKIQNTTNSTTAFQVQNTAGTVAVLNVDTINTRVGIGTSAPTSILDVQGTIENGLIGWWPLDGSSPNDRSVGGHNATAVGGTVAATGGTETTYVGNGTNGILGKTYKVHTFTGSGTFTVSTAGSVDVLVVGGGGAGGPEASGRGGGGGGGGAVNSAVISLGTGGNTVTVGGVNGTSSVGATSAAGGGNGGPGDASSGTGRNGGTSGNGNIGGLNSSDSWSGGGGGGAGGAGGDASPGNGGAGGPGVSSSITGSAVTYGAGAPGAVQATAGAGASGIVIIRYVTDTPAYVATGKVGGSYSPEGVAYFDAGNVSSSVKSASFWVKGTSAGKILDFNGSAYVSINGTTVSTTGITGATIYVDGVAGSTVTTTNWHFITVTATTAINASAVKFGSVDANSLFGQIDDTKFYSYVLSAREVGDKYGDGAVSLTGGGTVGGALTVTTNVTSSSDYVLSVDNQSTSTSSKGLLVKLGVANASRTTSNYFIGFADSTGTIAGKIQGGTSAVAYTTTGADYAEYFKANPGDLPQKGELVMLDPSTNQGVLRTTGNLTTDTQPLAGIVSTNPGFIGNGPLCNADDADCDKNYAKYNALVALSGQVPANVNDTNGPIAIGDPITLSTVAGEGAKAINSGYIVGYAIEPLASGSGTIKVLVRPQHYTTSNSQSLQGNGLNITGSTVLTGNLSISGDTTLTGALTISGLTTVEDLTVTGNATFTGTLSVQNISVANITINGHIITAGNAPTITPGIAAGVEDIANSIAAPVVTINGNDTSGTITVVAGASSTNGVLAEVTFSTPFGAIPKVMLNAGNEDTANLKFYRDADTGKFRIKLLQAPIAGQTYTFDYLVIQ